MFDVLGRVAAPMRLPVRWLLWRCHGGAHATDGVQTSQGISRGCGRCVRGGRKFHSALVSNNALPFGFHQRLESSISRTKLLTCNGASGGRGGDAQQGSSEEVPESGGSFLRTVQTIPQLSWQGFRRFSWDVIREKQLDEGDWRYSPEWWGTQAGGWGHNAGETVFEAPSVMWNGVVSVTSHPTSIPVSSKPHMKRRQVDSALAQFLSSSIPFIYSKSSLRQQQKTSSLQAAQKLSQQDSEKGSNGLSGGAFHEVLGYEWRVLRFNSFTRQSVAKVKAVSTVVGDVVLLQQPNCVAFEYVKSMIAAGLSSVSLAGLDLQRVHSGYEKIRILCIGLGGGSLPLFLAHNLPGASVEIVEIDATVILAAVRTMGFPPSNNGATKDQAILWGDMLDRIILHENDGESYVCEQSRKVLAKEAKLEYDLVFVDAFDGEDVVPLKLWDRNGPFLSSLSSLLHADHGTVVVNLHTDSPFPGIMERISGRFGPGFDPTLPQGKRVQEAALAYRDILLKESDSMSGLAFTVAVSLQGNISLVVSRLAATSEMCRALAHGKANTDQGLIQTFANEADRVEKILNVSFDMSKRVQRGFQIVES